MPSPGVENDWIPLGGNPILSIVIPVYRESRIINGLLEHLFQVEDSHSAEIIIVDGDAGSTLRGMHPGFRPLIRTFLSAPGRGRQMNRGAEMALAPYLLFLHADARLPHNAIPKIIHSLATGSGVIAGAFALDIGSSNPVLRMLARVATLRSLWTRIPYGDQAFFLSRTGFRDLGGFRDWPLMEDVELMQRIRVRGLRIVLLPEKVEVSPRRWEKEGVTYCTLRNWALLFLFWMGIPPARLVLLYPPSSHEAGTRTGKSLADIA